MAKQPSISAKIRPAVSWLRNTSKRNKPTTNTLKETYPFPSPPLFEVKFLNANDPSWTSSNDTSRLTHSRARWFGTKTSQTTRKSPSNSLLCAVSIVFIFWKRTKSLGIWKSNLFTLLSNNPIKKLMLVSSGKLHKNGCQILSWQLNLLRNYKRIPN